MGTLRGFHPAEGELEAAAATAVRLYGTPTSPYTRKLRILARAAGLDVTFVDTRSEGGAGALARIAPLGKVPVVELVEPSDDGGAPGPGVLADSGLISAWLWARHAPALRAAGFDLRPDDWEDRARLVVVEGALDAAINRFYLLRDGLPDQGYVTRQAERVVTALTALDALRPIFARPLPASALSLGCALDWMVFRKMADPGRYAHLHAFHEAWRASGVGAGTEPAA
jgi:glutathione S-transferase